MPNYHFHVCNDEPDLDEQSIELPGIEIARAHALRLAGALIAESDNAIWGMRPWTMTVCDDVGTALISMMFQAVGSDDIGCAETKFDLNGFSPVR